MRPLVITAVVVATTGLLGACAPCPDGTCGPRTVVVTAISQYVSENGTSESFDMLPKEDGGIGVFMHGAGGTRTYRGSFSDGGFVVPNVGGPSYVVQLDESLYDTDSDQLDLGFRNFGRPFPTYASEGRASLSLTTSGLASWASSDDLQLLSPGVELYAYLGKSGVGGLPGAGPAPTELSFDWGGLEGSRTPLVEAAKGDSLWLAHMRATTLTGTADGGAGSTTAAPLSCLRAISQAQLKTLDMSTGSNSATAAFSATPSTVPVQFAGSEWAALASGVSDTVELRSMYLYADAAPDLDAVALDLLSCDVTLDAGQRLPEVQASVPVADGFPGGWHRRLTAGIGYRVAAAVGSLTWTHAGGASVTLSLGQPVRPGVRPPRELTLSGTDALLLTSHSSAQPLEVSWAPNPAGTTPTTYLVILAQYENERGVTSAASALYARTSATHFTFPAGTLLEDHVAMLRVRAMDHTAEADAPLRGKVQSTADALSRPFLVGP